MLPGSSPLRVAAAAADAATSDHSATCTADLRRALLTTIARRRSPALQFPLPVLAHAHHNPAVREYLAWWAKHPNPSGTYAGRTRWLRRLPGAWLLRTMFALGYDGLVYLHGGAPVGHVFFQRRGAELHAFSTAVEPPFDRSGYSVVMLLDYVTYAAACPGVLRARVGRGQNNATQRFLERLRSHERELGWRVQVDGWVHFQP